MHRFVLVLLLLGSARAYMEHEDDMLIEGFVSNAVLPPPNNRAELLTGLVASLQKSPIQKLNLTDAELRSILAKSMVEVNELEYSKYPYIVEILYRDEYMDSKSAPKDYSASLGYGVIISENYVLWTGCIYSDGNFTVAADFDGHGVGRIRHRVESVTWQKPSQDPGGCGLVLLKLAEPIELGAKLQPVELPGADEKVKTGEKAIRIQILLSGKLTKSVKESKSGYDCYRASKFDPELHSMLRSHAIFEPNLAKVALSSFFCTRQDRIPDSDSVNSLDAVFIGNRLASLDAVGFVNGYQVYDDIAQYRDWIKKVTGV